MEETREQILSQGFVESRVKVAGLLQRHKFFVVKEKTPFGEVAYLEAKTNVPQAELARLAAESGFPVRSPLGVAFPPGKSPKDLAAALQ